MVSRDRLVMVWLFYTGKSSTLPFAICHRRVLTVASIIFFSGSSHLESAKKNHMVWANYNDRSPPVGHPKW